LRRWIKFFTFAMPLLIFWKVLPSTLFTIAATLLRKPPV